MGDQISFETNLNLPFEIFGHMDLFFPIHSTVGDDYLEAKLSCGYRKIAYATADKSFLQDRTNTKSEELTNPHVYLKFGCVRKILSYLHNVPLKIRKIGDLVQNRILLFCTTLYEDANFKFTSRRRRHSIKTFIRLSLSIADTRQCSSSLDMLDISTAEMLMESGNKVMT